MDPGDAGTAAGTRAPLEPTDRLVLSQKRMHSVAASDRETLIRGRRAFERGDDVVALEHLARLINHLSDRGHEYADVHYMIGIIQERQGKVDLAIDSLRQATRVNPGYVEALLALASLHERRGDYDISSGYAERASQLAQSPEGGLDMTTRGKLSNQQAELAQSLAAAGCLREAIDAYRSALERTPHFHDIRHQLGLVLREAGLPSQAAQEFQRVLAARPALLDSQIQLGLTYYSLGQTPEALREWERVVDTDPGRDDARMYIRLVSGAASREESAMEPTENPESGTSTIRWETRSLQPVSNATGNTTDTPDTPEVDSSIESLLDFPDAEGDTDASLLDFDELEALAKLESIPMPSSDDFLKD